MYGPGVSSTTLGWSCGCGASAISVSRCARKNDGEPLHLAIAERFGQVAQQHDPVFERIAGARRRLRAVGEHPPLAVRRARQVHGVQVEMNAVRDANAVARPQERRVREHERRRQQPGARAASGGRTGRPGSD